MLEYLELLSHMEWFSWKKYIFFMSHVILVASKLKRVVCTYK